MMTKALRWRGPCHAYTARRTPCRRKASGFGPGNTPACWQHQRHLKRWQSALTPGLGHAVYERSATR